MGVTLGIHPLAVLIVTLAGGALFGTIGLILSAPLVAAAAGVLRDIRSAKAQYPPGAPADLPQASP
jgi:predicted PurR-regulated permease PerM